VADLQEQAASPSDLQISPDFRERKSDQLNKTWEHEMKMLGQFMTQRSKSCDVQHIGEMADWGGFEPPTP